jgi:hypothetical protein
MIQNSTGQRFNLNANSINEAIVYIENRAVQMLKFDYRLVNLKQNEWGVDATFVKDNKEFQSIYLLEQFRGKGMYKTLVTKPIITSKQCGLDVFLEKNNIEHVSLDMDIFEEYKIISDFYGDTRAKRSGVSYMNHIDEGLAILNVIDASELAKRTYCIHPIYQSDFDLFTNLDQYKIDSDVMLRVIEYRSVANEYLSFREINSFMDIRLSPVKDVNDMLIADKIQNRKDFELYHKGKHKRSKELERYFLKWCQRLGITEDEYKQFKKQLTNG